MERNDEHAVEKLECGAHGFPPCLNSIGGEINGELAKNKQKTGSEVDLSQVGENGEKDMVHVDKTAVIGAFGGIFEEGCTSRSGGVVNKEAN